MILAWKFRSKTQWEFSFSEWMTTWSLQGAFNIQSMKDAVLIWRNQIEDPDAFNVFMDLFLII